MNSSGSSVNHIFVACQLKARDSCCQFQLKVAAVDVAVQEMVLELEHSQLRQLLHSNSDLERSVDRDTSLPAFQGRSQACPSRSRSISMHFVMLCSPPSHPSCWSLLIAARAFQWVFSYHSFLAGWTPQPVELCSCRYHRSCGLLFPTPQTTWRSLSPDCRSSDEQLWWPPHVPHTNATAWQ